MFNTTAVKSALVSLLLMAIITVGGYIISLGNIFAIDWKVLANLAVISFLTGLVSIVKNLLTTEQGTALGIQVK